MQKYLVYGQAINNVLKTLTYHVTFNGWPPAKKKNENNSDIKSSKNDQYM
jgi:hypothetical protein